MLEPSKFQRGSSEADLTGASSTFLYNIEACELTIIEDKANAKETQGAEHRKRRSIFTIDACLDKRLGAEVHSRAANPDVFGNSFSSNLRHREGQGKSCEKWLQSDFPIVLFAMGKIDWPSSKSRNSGFATVWEHERNS